MRLAKCLIPVVLVTLSGPTPPPEFDTPSPTLDAAAPIRVRDGTARFRVPARGRIVTVLSLSRTSISGLEPTTEKSPKFR